MTRYRITIRYGSPQPQYHMLDVDAPTLREALRRAADGFPDQAEATADLAEIRRHVEPEAREYGPG